MNHWIMMDHNIGKEKLERTCATDIISNIWCGRKNYAGHNDL